MFNAARPAARPLTPIASTPTPTMPVSDANNTAWGIDIRPDGSGRVRVRVMRASRGTSRI